VQGGSLRLAREDHQIRLVALGVEGPRDVRGGLVERGDAQRSWHGPGVDLVHGAGVDEGQGPVLEPPAELVGGGQWRRATLAGPGKTCSWSGIVMKAFLSDVTSCFAAAKRVSCIPAASSRRSARPRSPEKTKSPERQYPGSWAKAPSVIR